MWDNLKQFLNSRMATLQKNKEKNLLAIREIMLIREEIEELEEEAKEQGMTAMVSQYDELHDMLSGL